MGEIRNAEDPGAGEPIDVEQAGEQLRRLRVAAGMILSEVAERAGIDADWLRRLEAGEGT